MKITIRIPEQKEIEKEYQEEITATQILSEYCTEYPILACKINQKYARLDTRIEEDCVLEFFDQRDSYANLSYQKSLTMVYLKAIQDIAGKNARVRIMNSISKGIFTTIHETKFSKEELVEKITKRMRDIIRADYPILQVRKDRETLLNWMHKRNEIDEEYRVFENAYDLRDGFITTLDDCQHIFYQHLLPSSGYVKNFELHVYRKGIVLRFPQPSSPNEIPLFEEQNLLYEAFSEERHWEKLSGVREVSELNEHVLHHDYQNLILLSEALHEKKIADIARMILEKKKRIVLIAGPSSSGKTSFAKRLCIQLQVAGLNPLYLGTDDYFVNREDLKIQEDGTRDFESLSAVDVNLFTKQMNALLNHEKVDLPEFNFLTGEKEYGKRIVQLKENQIVVIEGIHGLNPELTKGIQEKEKFKIYISPLTQLSIDRYHRIPTTDARMLRRLVRDYRTRGVSAEDTIASWPSVRKGEEKNIFPYNGEADVFFNSQCIYELAVLKKYAEPLLKEISYRSKQYAEAQRMLKFLEFFVAIQDDSCIANNSIIREFIGGSVLVS